MLTQKDFLLSSSFTISYSRHTKFYVLHTAKVIYFLLIILSILIPVHSLSSQTCDYATNPQEVLLTQLFCSPQGNERFMVGQYVTLSWNPSNANLFAPDENVEIYLFRKRQNATGLEDMIMLNPGNSTEFLVNPLKDNSIELSVENSWLPSYNYSIQSENEIHTFLFRVIPSNSEKELDRAFSSPTFTVLESNQGSNSSSVKAVSTPTATNIVSTPSINSIDTKDKEKDKSGSSAFIAFIIVASVAAFLAFIAIVIAVKSRKRVDNQTKHQSLSNLSASSSTPMITSGKFGNNNRDPESPAEAESIHSTTPLAKEEMRSKPKSTVSFSNENQPISASDAALLSDAFRKVLRKPDWKPEDEEDDDTNLSQEERLRRREAKELMKKELAEEGTDLHSISRRLTKVEVHNISNELEKDGVSHSSESESK